MRQRAWILVFTALPLVCACTQPPDLEAEKQELLQLDRLWSDAATSDDMERLLSFWAEDAVIYPTGTPAVVGKDAIRKFLEMNRSIPGFSISWAPTEAVVSALGDLGYTLGRTQITVPDAEGNPIVSRGKYTVVWRKQADGSWKCVVDMFNFDQPAVRPSETPEEP